ncbi:LLM class flavin-dependent oxidoreductase [Rhizobium sp. BK602]|uniref:LLM class flavin-dependent oxidoreductase n=1 Tax=Rhizobium sp. BK602 TaxID=2586986 RepID=UPI00160AFB30|nr:LLM class flavin-dependent oxidoreductase [Rhizobium sp. BK602]MBB3612405.1 alkanesulfonate monooxygenase SsuD/methylene tetrahydromethanopterin reductase-like flavin-dependent oxidoreductase (luciferase family) [Rhizobium sp. BK602]
MTQPKGIHLGIGLDLAEHENPRDAGRRDFWDALVKRLDGSADFVTLQDRFARADGDGLDAILLANWLGAHTRDIGIIAGAPLNFLEPFHLSTAIATLDYVSEGRAGLLVQRPYGEEATSAARAIGPLGGFPTKDTATLDRDTLAALEVVRRLWDSWEDGAEIRDKQSQRFLDGSKLHYIDFKSDGFSVLGPSITPRPPQGQPVVATTLAQGDDPALAVAADLIFLRGNADGLKSLLEAVRGRTAGHPSLVLADITVAFGHRGETGSPALHWSGDVKGLAEQVAAWAALGLDGFRFHPRDPERDLGGLVETVFPALRQAGLASTTWGFTLRARLGLPPAANRYTTAA